MAVSVVEDTTGTTATDGTLQTLFTKEDAGVFFVRMDISAMVFDATPDVLEVSEFISAKNDSTQRMMEGSPKSYTAGLAPALFELPHRSVPANCSYAVKVQRVGGSDFNIVWALIEVG